MEMVTDKKILRKFGFIMGGMFAFLFGILFPWIFGNEFPRWPFYLLGGFCLLAIFIPISLYPIHWFWMKLGHCLGWINTRIILGFLFFFIFTPLSWFLKLIGKRPIQLKNNSELEYRVFRDPKRIMNMEVPY